jgi:HK97 gp10 family phage protein
MRPLFEITGDKELDRKLKDLGQNALKDSQIKSALRKLAGPVIETMKQNVKNPITGQLQKSMGIIKNIRSKKGRPFNLVGPRYYLKSIKHPVDIVEIGSQLFDVEFEGQKFVKRTYEQHKTKLISQLRQELLNLLDKKLKKL